MRTRWQAVVASPLTRAAGILALTATAGLVQAGLTGAWPGPDDWVTIAGALTRLWPARHAPGRRARQRTGADGTTPG
ncbi:hypothetical protein R8Z50_12310 [Longispora sp. K20-0274]|uniref:hypothetical protein n=1 Tax=Longispora sp. K20-0274 TaxID=3088255 RepID=UPI003999EB79